MRWEGTAEFRAMNADIAEEVRVAAARVCYESAKETREHALANFMVYKIRMITGRSRALYSIGLTEGMLTPGATKVTVEVGYNSWPKTDIHSPENHIEFYPWFLNFGTVHMKARPYHTTAVDEVEPYFYESAYFAMRDAFNKASAKYKEPL